MVIEWEEIIRKENPRGKKKDEVVYKAFEGKASSEGYRLIWYRSSQKIALDEKMRRSRIAKAEKGIEALQNRTGKHQFKSIGICILGAIVADRVVYGLHRTSRPKSDPHRHLTTEK